MKYLGNFTSLHNYNDIIQDFSLPCIKERVGLRLHTLRPGMIITMSQECNFNSIYRKYWASLQDYVPGHVFVYNNTLISGYKAGDVFQYLNINDQYGAANISLTDFKFLEIIEIKK